MLFQFPESMVVNMKLPIYKFTNTLSKFLNHIYLGEDISMNA